jgi:CHAD domain-containing protein
MSDVRRFTVVGAGDPESLLASIAGRADLQPVGELAARRTFLDTADGRLAAGSTSLEMRVPVRGGAEPCLVWSSDTTGEVLATVALDEPRAPRFAGDLPPGPAAARLADVIEMRALLPQAEVMSRLSTLARLDDEAKTIVRVVVDHSTPLGGSTLAPVLEVLPVRGYARAATSVADVLAAQVVLEELDVTPVERARRALDAPPYLSSKLRLTLDPEASAEVAWREVLATLFRAMQQNLDGTRDDTDSEFLHDFRVAVRRTRSVLKEGRRILPEDLRGHWQAEFKWLGDVTTPTRDADVHLLDLPGLVAEVPAERAPDLDPLRALMVARQLECHRQLVHDLDSARYAQLVTGWRRFLDTRWTGTGPEATAPAGEVAAARLAKAWSTVVRDGRAIGATSPPEALHDLRKDAKRLRYLLECFGSTLDPDDVVTVVRSLKGLQDVLGTYQDTEVQAVALGAMASELVASGAPAATLLTMGAVIERVQERGHEARQHFAERFAAFDDKEMRRTFRRLRASHGAPWHRIDHPRSTDS